MATGLLALSLSLPVTAAAQVFGTDEGPEITVGAGLDLVNQYVWRGFLLSGDPNLQPYVSVAIDALEIGTWGSHSLDGTFHEQDFWVTYSLPPSPIGSLTLTINDYYANPDFGEDFFDFDDVGPCPEGETGFGTPPRCAGGAHTMEVVGAFSAAATPIDLLFAYNFRNDPENAMYAEVAYRPTLWNFEFGFTAGGVLGESEFYYGTDGTTLTNLGAAAATGFDIGRLSIPLGVEAIHNPFDDATHFVVRVGITGEW